MSSQRFPRTFGKYVLLRPFARGGMGEIYLAAHGELGGAEKLCLVKKVPEDRDAPGLTARLLDEAKVAVRLNHTNLVQVFDAGEVDDELYIAMELIEGRDLRAVWNRTAERRSRIPLDVALYVVREIARGLEYAHNYGGLNLVHRDIAPPNILISFHGEVKVTDFGLARSILKNEKTAPGIVYGRIAYLAPEQARGEQADARTDIFATGVILWELLTGRPLHDTGDDAVKNLDQARHPQIQAPSHLTRGLPSSIDAVSLKALATDREQRYQSAEEFRKAVADELARIAPGTDSSRVSQFLKDLFGDEIKKEAAERERMLREDLPKAKAAQAQKLAALAQLQAQQPAAAPSPSPSPGIGSPPPRTELQAPGSGRNNAAPGTARPAQVPQQASVAAGELDEPPTRRVPKPAELGLRPEPRAERERSEPREREPRSDRELRDREARADLRERELRDREARADQRERDREPREPRADLREREPRSDGRDLREREPRNDLRDRDPRERSPDGRDLRERDPRVERERRESPTRPATSLPGVRPTNNGGGNRPLPGMRAAPESPAPTSSIPAVRAQLQSLVRDAPGLEISDDERTLTVPPRQPAFTQNQASRSNMPAARAPAPVKPRPESGELQQPEALVGLVVDNRYRIERVLGTGGMGAVYEAEHVEIGKKVALKVLHPQYSRQADLVARFRREARAASKVGHPNIVDVTDSGTTPDGDVYFVMERLDGLDLGEVLRHERRVAPDRVVAIGTQVCRALSAAHAAGIIHRDLKPENIFLVSREGVPDFVKVLDFGIAKQDMGNQNSPRRLTTPGIAMGTPEYMAPEQAAGKAIDGRVDIYSVGAILYEMLTGEPPHHGANMMDILAKKATEDPNRPRNLNPEVPETLEEVVMRCLERDPDRRPQTMGALEYELTKSMKGRGSAVAAVLGLKPEESSSPSWGDESSKPRLFEPGVIQQRRASMPSIPLQRSGNTGAVPLTTDDGDKIRVNNNPTGPRLPIPEPTPARGARPEPPDEPSKHTALKWIGFIGGFACLAAAAFGGYKLLYPNDGQREKKATTTTPAMKPPEPPNSTELPAPPAKPPEEKGTDAPSMKTVEAPAAPDAPSKAELMPMLEWARRCAEAGRIISPPKDNLKELLDRIDKVDPGNPQAEALRAKTTAALGKKGALALKKGRLDEAQEVYQALVVLKPDDEQAKTRLARTLTVRSQRALGGRKLTAALSDAQAALELAPDDSITQLQLADVHLALGKQELAAEEYQRVLDVKPTDKRAKAGLAKATGAPSPGPIKATKPTKKKRGR